MGNSLETTFVQLGNRSDGITGAVNPPVYLSTAYAHGGIGESTGYDYSRTKNPTRSVLEEGFAMLEKAIELLHAAQAWQQFSLYYPYFVQAIHC